MINTFTEFNSEADVVNFHYLEIPPLSLLGFEDPPLFLPDLLAVMTTWMGAADAASITSRTTPSTTSPTFSSTASAADETQLEASSLQRPPNDH